MKIEFAWDKNSLSHADTVSSVPHLIDKDMVREPTSKMKYGKASGPSGVVSEIVKAAGVDMSLHDHRPSKSDYSRTKELFQQNGNLVPL